MERMTPDTTDFNSLSKKQLVELVIAKYNDCFRLEEENKKLNEEIQRFKDNAMQDMREITELEIENKKLNEKVRFLEECLDRKEKLNEKYRKEIKSTYVYDAKQVRDIC